MNLQPINQLLDKYFDGQTSLQEEQELRRYFNGTQVDPSLEAYRPYFQFLTQAKQTQLSPDFESKLLQELKNEPPKSARLRTFNTYLLRVAAVALLALAVFFLLPGDDQPRRIAEEINWEALETQNEQEAFEQTKAALKLLSSKLNGTAKTATKGLKEVQAISKVFE